jgi:hypothetical protein
MQVSKRRKETDTLNAQIRKNADEKVEPFPRLKMARAELIQQHID